MFLKSKIFSAAGAQVLAAKMYKYQSGLGSGEYILYENPTVSQAQNLAKKFKNGVCMIFGKAGEILLWDRDAEFHESVAEKRGIDYYFAAIISTHRSSFDNYDWYSSNDFYVDYYSIGYEAKNKLLKYFPEGKAVTASRFRIVAKPIELESYSGKKFFVFKNPVVRQAQHLAHRYPLGLRGLIKDNDFYIWDADTIIHDHAARELELHKPYVRVLITKSANEASGYDHPKMYVSSFDGMGVILEANDMKNKQVLAILHKYFPPIPIDDKLSTITIKD